MNKLFFVIIIGLGLSASSCKQKEDTTIVTDTAVVGAQHTTDAVEEVAGDKELLRQAMILAEQKGTLQSALFEAVQDSMVYIRLQEAVAAARASKQTASASSTKSRTGTKSNTSTGSKKSGDGFDKAEGAVDKAGHAVDRTTTIVNKADEVSKKAGDIFRRK